MPAETMNDIRTAHSVKRTVLCVDPPTLMFMGMLISICVVQRDSRRPSIMITNSPFITRMTTSVAEYPTSNYRLCV